MKKFMLFGLSLLMSTTLVQAQSGDEVLMAPPIDIDTPSAIIAPIESSEVVKDVPLEENSKIEVVETSETLETSEAVEKRGWRFHLRPDFNFGRIEATDTNGEKAVVASKNINPGAKFGVNTNLSQNLSMGLIAAGWYSNLHTESDEELKNANNVLWRVGLGLNYKFTEAFSIGAEGSYANQLFIYRSEESLSMEQISLPMASLNARWDLIRATSFTLGISGVAGHIFAGKNDLIDMDSGSFYRGSLYTVLNTDRPILANIYFEQSDQKSNLGELVSTTVGLSLTMVMNSLGDQ